MWIYLAIAYRGCAWMSEIAIRKMLISKVEWAVVEFKIQACILRSIGNHCFPVFR